ncbi:cyclin [Aspergillus heteromorphus CBS 117.55]|uniref:Cyclin n=1 Tax=Aspergillus heteromorphus CBS 117.55 TaxID=1448321 RepID=A0A317V564_9EURO|nr:cyclin [Aspergillus heteromorphus CBS 117.55]PWY68421.1 cyclin [Aspergillus heteromorphus CBS 117.55]
MDFYLRCNSLKCRAQLKERAVVTTCSHIFCLHCAGCLGLSHPTADERRCPACQTVLINPDDAVATVLNPTEDYKTSVLSGLDPNTIMECAGRALLFWTYQTTQEIFYQEFLAKTLTEKYATLNAQMDKVIHNANSEISTLQARISDMQATQDQLHKKNQELVDMYREKCKKFAQMTNLYNLLKSRAMRSQMQTAASDTVSQALNSLAVSRGDQPVLVPKLPGASALPQTPSTRQSNTYPVSQEGVEQLDRHQRSGTGSSKGAKQKADMAAMPPPPIRQIGNPRQNEIPAATPQHRTRLGGSSRPSTGKSQLPHDSVMLERFGTKLNPRHGFINTHGSVDRGATGMPLPGQTGGATEQPGMRSIFDNTIL